MSLSLLKVSVVDVFKTDFFFQAEDGIRDGRVTGVQTCALPICFPELHGETEIGGDLELWNRYAFNVTYAHANIKDQILRSEERRVGKECRSRWSLHE